MCDLFILYYLLVVVVFNQRDWGTRHGIYVAARGHLRSRFFHPTMWALGNKLRFSELVTSTVICGVIHSPYMWFCFRQYQVQQCTPVLLLSTPSMMRCTATPA